MKIKQQTKITPKVTVSKPDYTHTVRQKKITKLKEAVALTQEYADEIINELEIVNKNLQSANKELISSSEKLKSFNEELQTLNEEVTIALDYADAIIRTARVPLIILNSKLRIISANDSFYTTFKVTPNETENILLYDVGNKQWNIPKLRILLEEILPEKNTVENFIVEHEFESLGQRTMLLSARLLRQGPDKNPRILLSIEDITERKQLEQQKDEFIGIASHELKTPVTSIKAYTQILQSRFIKAKDMQSAELAGKMDAQLNKLTSLIGDLLDITKIEAGRLQFHEDYFDFNELASEIAEEFQITTKKYKIITELAKIKTVHGDRDRLGQVITNFISNALKYSPHANKVIIKTIVNSDRITLCVKDFGIGLSKEDQTHVFERYYRTAGSSQTTYPGLGLGLYIASEIIKRQNGKIWVESKKGKGSLFCFSLPIQKTKIKQQKNTLVEEEIKHG